MMKMKSLQIGMLAAWMALCASSWRVVAEEIPASLQAKIDGKLQMIQGWASEATVVNAVKAHNANLPADQAAMTQEKWKDLSVLDPFVRSFTKNEVAALLKGKQGSVVSEAFISGADGKKVAFLSKTTNWSHKGKEKHDVPMSGKSWKGPIETDESSGQRQMQIAVPVMDNGKAIGSLVVGLAISKLERE